MKTHIFLSTLLLIAAGCMDKDKDDPIPDCSCSSTYTEYHDPISQATFISIPNIFTPNNDGINDLFTIYGQGINQFTLVVKDGNNTVFSTNNPSEWWDGTVDGNEPPACQTFDYVVDVNFENGTTKHFENTVTVFNYDLTITCPDNISKCVFPAQFDGTGFNLGITSGENLSGC